MEKMNKIKEIFIKIKQGHEMYKRGNNAYKGRLIKAFNSLFNELEQLGIERVFSESLLFWGKEFVDSVMENNEWYKVKKKVKN